jgi:hypothetical protein
MPGFMPAIHAFNKTWMAGTSPAMTVISVSLERNLVVHVVALAAGAGHRRLALA